MVALELRRRNVSEKHRCGTFTPEQKVALALTKRIGDPETWPPQHERDADPTS
jgi:hypothetical protein